MTEEKQQRDDIGTCPNCGEPVTYRGVGRRPIWCSTRCRNDAALKRLGARRGAIEVRVVEVHRQGTGAHPDEHELPSRQSRPNQLDLANDPQARAQPSPEQALRILRNNPEAVGRLLALLERRRADGTLLDPEWLPVRNALRLIAQGLPTGIERPV
jgi:hypothetical protein